MTIKSTIFGKLGMIAIWLFSLTTIYLFINENLPIGLILFFIIFSAGLFCMVIISFTTRITLSEKGIFVSRNMGLGWIMPKKYGFYWHEIKSVDSILFAFIPVKIFWIIGTWKGRHHQILLGNLWTKKREALVYILDHVHREVFKKSTYKLDHKYKKKLEKKAHL